MNKRPFNMIEIAIALGVAAIAIVSIMALFPVGYATGRDAMAETYAAESADEFMHQLERFVRSDWNQGLAFIPEAPATPQDPPPFPDDLSAPGVEQISPTLYEYGSGSNLVYKVIRFVDTDDSGDYNPAVDILDFEAIITVYRSQVEIPVAGAPDQELDESIAVRLEMEISWPARLPYAQREKRQYFYEIFNR